MQGLNLLESFSEFKEVRNISREKLLLVLQEVFRSAIRKKYGSDENFDIVLNPEKGDIEMFQNLEVVEDDDFEDEVTEISLTDAQKIDPDYEVGDDHIEQIFITKNVHHHLTNGIFSITETCHHGMFFNFRSCMNKNLSNQTVGP